MTYQIVAKAVSDAGFFTTGDDSKLICASKIRPEGGYTGNSFWVAQRDCGWCFGTWGSHVYRIPKPERIPELCVAWLRRHPDGTASDVDRYTREEFALVEIDPENLRSAYL
jgi:hypothetical protein